MTYLITPDGTRHRMARPLVTTVTKTLVTIHRPRTTYDDGYLEAVSMVQRAGQPVYKVTGLRARIWCPESLAARFPSRRQPWQPVIVPAHLDTHELVVSWLVAGLASDVERELSA